MEIQSISINMIKTIIFDWAGVLTTGRYTQAILEAINKKHDIDIDGVYAKFDNEISKIMEGKLSTDEFVSRANKILKTNFSKEDIIEIFKKSIVHNKNVIKLLKDLLSKKYNLILFSDNDELTTKILSEDHGDILECFSKKYYSFEQKTLKSNPKFVESVAKDLGLLGQEFIFIDDKEKNLHDVPGCTVHNILFKDTIQLKKELASYSIRMD